MVVGGYYVAEGGETFFYSLGWVKCLSRRGEGADIHLYLDFIRKTIPKMLEFLICRAGGYEEAFSVSIIPSV